MSLQLPILSWTSSPNYSSRGGQRVRLIVVHDCEGSLPGSVSWFALAKSQVSAHIVLSEDGASAVQMVAWANKAWHACDVNSYSEGVEAAGYAAKGLAAPEWAALAAIVAFRLKANGIPRQRASAANGWTGYCQHVDLGAMGGGHHDITLDPDVRARFDALVAIAYAQAMPAGWTPAGQAAAPTAPADWKPSGTVRHDLIPGSIEWAQAALNKARASTIPLTVDGLDGPATRNAVKAFQAFVNTGAPGTLAVDGELGPLTIAALTKAAA